MDKQTLDHTLLKIWNEKDLSGVESLFSQGVILHSSLGDFQSSHEAKALIKKWQIAFPDLVVTHHHILQEENLFAVHWSAKGTHQGLFENFEPTEKSVRYAGCSLYKFESDQVVEYWSFFDRKNLDRQMSA